MRRAARILAWGGLAALLGGIGGFSYILFIHPSEDPPFRRVSDNLWSDERRTSAVEMSEDGYARVGVRFSFSTSYYSNHSYSSPSFAVRYRLRVVDVARDDSLVFEETARLEDGLAQTQVNFNPNGSITGDRITGNAEQQLTAFPVHTGQRLAIELELPPDEIDPNAAMGETQLNSGSASISEVYLLTGDYDPVANLNFRADGPTVALKIAGGGILALFAASWIAGRAKT